MEPEHESGPVEALETGVDQSGTSASVFDKSEINISDSAEQSQEKLAEDVSNTSEINISDSADQSQEKLVEDVSNISEINISEASESAAIGQEEAQSETIDSSESGGDDKIERNEPNAETTSASDSDGMAPPPEQAMERPEGYDPLRIPLSIFETSKSAAPTDWSVASNESLFSIHVGSSSFSTDHAVSVNELSKSEELTEDLALEEDFERRSFEAEEEEEGSRLSARVLKPTLLSLSSSQSLLSEGSDGSALSFAFPILPGSMCINEPMKPESDNIKPQKSSPTKTSKPTSPTNQWFWCFSCSTCLSWCSWPRSCSWPQNSCPCNCPRQFCCFYCCC